MIEQGDSRVHYGENAETILLRTNRRELVEYTVRRTGVKAIHTAWRDFIHASLWDSLTPQQQDSWEGILMGYNSIAGVMACKAFDPSRAHGRGTGGDDKMAVDQADYIAWANRVRHRKLNYDLIINVLAGGMSITKAAKLARMRKHMAGLVFRAGLDIYGEIRGWR